jgi:hypothetical protein
MRWLKYLYALHCQIFRFGKYQAWGGKYHHTAIDVKATANVSSTTRRPKKKLQASSSVNPSSLQPLSKTSTRTNLRRPLKPPVDHQQYIIVGRATQKQMASSAIDSSPTNEQSPKTNHDEGEI